MNSKFFYYSVCIHYFLLNGTHNDYFFVANFDVLTQTKALRSYRLYNLEIESWMNMDTKVFSIDGDGAIGVDHYGAELCLVGGAGA